MAHLMNNNTQHAVFRSFTIGAIFFRSAEIKTDHRILHTVSCLNALRCRIRIGDSKFRV